MSRQRSAAPAYPRWHCLSGVVATAAALVASVGDLLLLHVSLNGPGAAAHLLLLIGTYLGVLAIPLYGLGYWQVSRILQPSAPSAAGVVFGCGAYSGGLGAVVHGITAMAIRSAPAAAAGDPLAVLGAVSAYLAPLWLLLAALSLWLSVAYATAVASGSTALPRWTAVANPVCLILLIAAAAMPFRDAAAYVVPAAPNLAHVAFFGMVTTVSWRLRAAT